MDNLKIYIDSLMNNKNDEHTNSSFEYIDIKKGGSDEIEKHIPTGGFPPIFILKKEDKQKKNNKKIELINSKNNNNLNLNDIIKKKYNVKAFI